MDIIHSVFNFSAPNQPLGKVRVSGPVLIFRFFGMKRVFLVYPEHNASLCNSCTCPAIVATHLYPRVKREAGLCNIQFP